MPMPPNLNKMLEQAQKMQEEMLAAQEKLKEERIEASSGGGMVKVVVSGDGQVQALTIDPDAVDPEDVELLQDMVLAAVNEALRQADQLREKAMAGSSEFDPMSALDALGGLGGLGGGGGGMGGGLPGGGGAPNRAARRANKKR
jgi:nucleoid-associated protein EbfC